MKISNETKVGFLVVAALTMAIVGFNFLTGKELFSKSEKIYAVFTDLGSLDKTNAVKINGLSVGKVFDFFEKDKDVSAVIVEIHLTRDVNIPKNSIAFISADLLGSSSILIEKGDAKEYLNEGDTLLTREEPGILGSVQSHINPTLLSVRSSLDSLKLVISNVNKIFDQNTKGNIQDIIFNLQNATASIKTMLNPDSGPLATSLNNVSSITSNLKKNNDSITATINNAKRITENFAKLNLQQTIDSLDSALSELKTTLAKANSKEGTLGLLLNDKALYNKLNDAIISAETLMDDIRVHPKRYINISVFGKKDKTGPLNSPTKKDSTSSGVK